MLSSEFDPIYYFLSSDCVIFERQQKLLLFSYEKMPCIWPANIIQLVSEEEMEKKLFVTLLVLLMWENPAEPL